MSWTSVTYDMFCNLFDDEEQCLRALFAAKWPGGFRCPRCQHPHAFHISTRKLPLYECRSCHVQTSLIAGTVIQRSRTSVRMWLRALYLHARPEGINARQLSETIGVTYKTAWLICHKIRRAMSQKDLQELLTGLVRVTDARLCDRPTGSSGWHLQEQSVLAGSSENEQGEIIRIKIKKQNKQPLRFRYDSPPTGQFLSENVDPTAAKQSIVTRWLGPNRNHTLVRLVKDAERTFATMFRGIGPKHLQVYLDQFCYVWNRRNRPMFHELLSICATTRAITYPELVGCQRRRRSSMVPEVTMLEMRIAS